MVPDFDTLVPLNEHTKHIYIYIYSLLKSGNDYAGVPITLSNYRMWLFLISAYLQNRSVFTILGSTRNNTEMSNSVSTCSKTYEYSRRFVQ